MSKEILRLVTFSLFFFLLFNFVAINIESYQRNKDFLVAFEKEKEEEKKEEEAFEKEKEKKEKEEEVKELELNSFLMLISLGVAFLFLIIFYFFNRYSIFLPILRESSFQKKIFTGKSYDTLSWKEEKNKRLIITALKTIKIPEDDNRRKASIYDSDHLKKAFFEGYKDYFNNITFSEKNPFLVFFLLKLVPFTLLFFLPHFLSLIFAFTLVVFIFNYIKNKGNFFKTSHSWRWYNFFNLPYLLIKEINKEEDDTQKIVFFVVSGLLFILHFCLAFYFSFDFLFSNGPVVIEEDNFQKRFFIISENGDHRGYNLIRYYIAKFRCEKVTQEIEDVEDICEVFQEKFNDQRKKEIEMAYPKKKKIVNNIENNIEKELGGMEGIGEAYSEILRLENTENTKNTEKMKKGKGKKKKIKKEKEESPEEINEISTNTNTNTNEKPIKEEKEGMRESY